MEENHDNQHLDSRKDIIPLISILYWPLSVLQLSDSERRQPIENPASLTFLMQLTDSGRCPLYHLKDLECRQSKLPTKLNDREDYE
jgi:hypothetical protein